MTSCSSGIPRAAWDHLDDLRRRREGAEAAGADPTGFWLVEIYLQSAEAERDAGRLSDVRYHGHATQLGKFRALPFEGKTVGDVKAHALSADLADDFFDANQGHNVLDCLTACFEANCRGHALPSLPPVATAETNAA